MMRLLKVMLLAALFGPSVGAEPVKFPLMAWDYADDPVTLKATVSDQGPRIFVTGLAGEAFIVCRKGIAKVDPRTHALAVVAESPVEATSGGDYFDGRIYFNAGSHLYSWQVQ